MNEFDKHAIENLIDLELSSLTAVNKVRKNTLNLREYLLHVLSSYEYEVKDYFYEERLNAIQQIIEELSLKIHFSKELMDCISIDIEYVAMLIEIYETVHELEVLIDKIQENKLIKISKRVENFLSKTHRLILNFEIIDAEIESICLFEEKEA